MATQQHIYKDPRPLARTVVVFMFIYLATVAANLVAVGLETLLLGGSLQAAPVSEFDGMTGIELAAVFTRLASMALYVIVGFMFLMWIYRSTANARTFRPSMNAKPGWAVGWFFVPIAFLWKPYQYFSETWRVSHSPGTPASEPTPSLLRWWWAAWLISNFTSNLAGRLSMREDEGMLLAANVFELVSDAVTIPLVLIGVWMLRTLSARQAQTHDLGGEASVFA